MMLHAMRVFFMEHILLVELRKMFLARAQTVDLSMIFQNTLQGGLSARGRGYDVDISFVSY